MLFILPGAEYPIPTAITFAIVLIFAFAYHELAHGVVADRLGEPTPRASGRITLNPAKNLDRTGLILALLIGFGWASIPINPNYFRGNPRRSFAIVAVAGPLANLLMAALFGLPVLLGLVEVTPPREVLPSLYSFLTFGVYFNLFLASLNLIPIPPLDGFRILLGILPPHIAIQLEQLYPYSMIIFLAVFILLPRIGVSIAQEIAVPVINFFYPLLTGGLAPLFI